MTKAGALGTLVGRAILLRCPRCGAKGILLTWFRMRERCARCNLALDRGEAHDYWLGGYAINMVVAEGSAAVVALACLFLRWPDTTLALRVGLTLAIGMPLVFYPFSRTLWLAVDLRFRARETGDD